MKHLVLSSQVSKIAIDDGIHCIARIQNHGLIKGIVQYLKLNGMGLSSDYPKQPVILMPGNAPTYVANTMQETRMKSYFTYSLFLQYVTLRLSAVCLMTDIEIFPWKMNQNKYYSFMTKYALELKNSIRY